MHRVLIIALLAALLLPATDAWAQRKKRPRAKPARAGLQVDNSFVHLLGLRLDGGERAFAAGATYGFAFQNTLSLGQLGLKTRLGAGLDAKIIAPEALNGIAAGMATGLARATFIGKANGLGLELGAGLGVEGRGAMLAATGGIFYAGDTWEIGYSYQHPFLTARPYWLNSHQISLRLHIPVFEH